MLSRKLNACFVVTNWLIYLFLLVVVGRVIAGVLGFLFYPNDVTYYDNAFDINKFDNSAKYISNRYPFGEIVIPASSPTPSILANLKLTGVYLNGASSSLAFVELAQKSLILKIGSLIGGNYRLSNINPFAITFTDDKTGATSDIHLTSSALNNVHNGANKANSTNVANAFEAHNNANINIQNTTVGIENRVANNDGSNGDDNNQAARKRQGELIEEYLRHRQQGSEANSHNN